MAKQLIVTYEGRDYTLEFTRATTAALADKGFSINELQNKPDLAVVMLPTLFHAAFLAHHKFIKPDVTTKIFDTMGNRDELFSRLIEMYQEPFFAMMDDPEDATEGNSNWKAAW